MLFDRAAHIAGRGFVAAVLTATMAASIWCMATFHAFLYPGKLSGLDEFFTGNALTIAIGTLAAGFAILAARDRVRHRIQATILAGIEAWDARTGERLDEADRADLAECLSTRFVAR